MIECIVKGVSQASIHTVPYHDEEHRNSKQVALVAENNARAALVFSAEYIKNILMTY